MGERLKKKPSRTLEENIAYYVDLENAAKMIQMSSMTAKQGMLRKIKERKHRLKKRIAKQIS